MCLHELHMTQNSYRLGPIASPVNWALPSRNSKGTSLGKYSTCQNSTLSLIMSTTHSAEYAYILSLGYAERTCRRVCAQ